MPPRRPRTAPEVETPVERPESFEDIAKEVLSEGEGNGEQNPGNSADEDWRARYEQDSQEWASERKRINSDFEDLRRQFSSLASQRLNQPQPIPEKPPELPALPDFMEAPQDYVHGYTTRQLAEYERSRNKEHLEREQRALTARIQRSEKMIRRDPESWQLYQQAQRDAGFRAFLDANPNARVEISFDPLPAEAILERYEEWRRGNDTDYYESEVERRVEARLAEREQEFNSKFQTPAAVQPPRGSIASIRGKTPAGKTTETDPLYWSAEQREAFRTKMRARRA